MLIRFRPLRNLLFRVLRPPLDSNRARKPCFRFSLTVDGWKVRLIASMGRLRPDLDGTDLVESDLDGADLELEGAAGTSTGGGGGSSILNQSTENCTAPGTTA